MSCARPPIRGGVLLIAAVLGPMSLAAGLAGAEPGPMEKPLAGRVFAGSRRSIDEALARPYDRDVPMGCVGDRVWASSPQGWAFRDDAHWLYLTNLRAFDFEVRDEHGLLVPDRATYYPSHIHYEGVAHKATTASASFTFALDNVENPLVEPFEPRSAGRAGRAAGGRTGTRSSSGRPGPSRGSTSLSSMMRRAANAGRPSRTGSNTSRGAGGWAPVRLNQASPERARPGKTRPDSNPFARRGSVWFSATPDSGSIPGSTA